MHQQHLICKKGDLKDVFDHKQELSTPLREQTTILGKILTSLSEKTGFNMTNELNSH